MILEEPYDCSLGVVIEHQEDPPAYIIRLADGRVTGVLAQGECSSDNVEADIASPAPAPEAPRELSKLTLRRRLRDLGVEPQFDALLDQMPNARADWDDAQVLSTADPMFNEYAEPIRAALGITSEQWTALIA